MTQEKKSTNNAPRRRAAKAKGKVLGVKVAYNENTPRSIVRKMLNTFTKCKDCGDRLLLKNLSAHVHKALLHVKAKAKKAKSKAT